ncbi:S8 family serine peptidase [uncultured Croceitalea sp.]|uniref:S8 family serine peptidase n=1 Tax=uncultured Croceitalea sp. TaxID=1798908 RepID=UPI00374E5834
MDYLKLVPTTKVILFFVVLILSFSTLFAQSKKQREIISETYDTNKLHTLISSFENDFKMSIVKMTQASKSSNFQLITKSEDGTITELSDFGTDGTPLFYSTFNTSSSKVSRANTLHKGGLLGLNLDGLDMQVGVWDAGVALTTHQEFDDRVLNTDSNNGDLGSHATMVTGTMISSGIKQNAKGVAFRATALSHDWTRDKIEVAQAAANGLLLSNHSYGINSSRVPDWYFGSYIKVSQDWDKIMYNAPYYLMVVAAGNSQTKQDNTLPSFGKSQDGFDLLLGFTTAKNGLVVAGADVKVNKKGELKEASVSGYSSFGPIDDSRIKPDLAGDGTLIYSTYSDNNQSYSSSMGTSMAAPVVTGSLLLLQEYHGELNGSYMKAATLKGLALHTADDVQEAGPDYKMGWGVLNTKKAAEVLTNREYSSIVSEETLQHGQSFSIKVKANGIEPLIASISWTDPEGNFINQGDLNNVTSALINDLDIRITKNGGSYFPWKMSAAEANANATKGDNRVDPFERIDIYDAEGEYTITVTHKGELTNDLQDFSLIVSGIQLTACKLIAPKDVQLDDKDDDSTSWSWGSIQETLYEVQYKEVNNGSWSAELTWDSTMKVSDLEIGKRYQIRLRSVCSTNLSSEFSEVIEFVFKGAETEIEEELPVNFNEELAITVYPNPAVSQIDIAADVSEDAVYMISTSSGNIIKKGKANEKIDVTSLQAGLYIITVQDYAGVKSTKFFKS